jgi:septal ring factor EnvC (AmiA/AmiB activator)
LFPAPGLRYRDSVRRLLALLILLPAAAFAQEADEAERLREIERLREEKAEAAQELRERTEAAAEQLRALQARLVRTAESLQAAEASATEAERALGRLGERRTDVSARLERRQRSISDVLGALQMLELTRPPALVVSPEDANEAAVAAIALSGVTPSLRAEAEALRRDLDEVEYLRLEAEREQRLLAQAETALAERRRLLEDLLAQRERRQAEDVTRLRRIEREDAALVREATTLQRLIEGIAARDATRETARPAPPVPASRPAQEQAAPELYASLPARFAEARARLPMPASGRIAGRFGDAVEGGGRSQDLAIETRPGAVVTAPFAGRVKWAKPYGALGNIVILDVGEDYSLVLMGLGEFAVRRDDQVRAGEPLGYMAQGRAGRLRLHLRKGAQVLDPEPWLLPEVDARAAGPT